ncbi:hypothetical protein D3C87_1362180 [compost metagenome]
MSAELNWPSTLRVVSSCTAPASLPVAKLSTGASLVPVKVIVTVCGAETALPAPLSSVATTV